METSGRCWRICLNDLSYQYNDQARGGICFFENEILEDIEIIHELKKYPADYCVCDSWLLNPNLAEILDEKDAVIIA